MAGARRFSFKDIAELKETASRLNLDLPLQEELSPLAREVKIGASRTPNSLIIHPMEGFDADEKGSPGSLALRRYRRFARGGAGLIWCEACAVVPEGRTNPRQFLLHRNNLRQYQDLVQMIRREAADSMGSDHRPLVILQLTHSGRYSKPQGYPEPRFAFHDPYLDPRCGIAAVDQPISDEELEELEERFAQAAVMAIEAGFDGVDIKSCHRYLSSELLAAFTREGKYGGSFENRTRFLVQTVEKVTAALNGAGIVAVRLNLYDGLPHPYGWGVNKEDESLPDLLEPVKLAALLKERGVTLLSVSAGNPYHNPYLVRPHDLPLPAGSEPAEHPLVGVARHFALVRELQQAHSDLAVAGSGYSWLRSFMGQAAAANLASRSVTLVGGGRMAFAYPDFAKDLLIKGALDPHKVCVTCSKCTQIMRGGGAAGCPVRDKDVYGEIYRKIAGTKA